MCELFWASNRLWPQSGNLNSHIMNTCSVVVKEFKSGQSLNCDGNAIEYHKLFVKDKLQIALRRKNPPFICIQAVNCSETDGGKCTYWMCGMITNSTHLYSQTVLWYVNTHILSSKNGRVSSSPKWSTTFKEKKVLWWHYLKIFKVTKYIRFHY